jgi:hypothetical protein
MAVISLTPLSARPPALLPARSYLARLSPQSRPTMRGSLRALASLLCATDPNEVAWEELRYPETSTLRNLLVERYAASTARRHLAALRGVLKQCWRLQLMSHEDLARASDLATNMSCTLSKVLESTRGSCSPSGGRGPAGTRTPLW